MNKLKTILVASFFALALTGVGITQEDWMDDPLDIEQEEENVAEAKEDVAAAAQEQGWEETDIEAAKDVLEDLVNENVDVNVARDEIIMMIEQGQTIDALELLTEEERLEDLRQRETETEADEDENDEWPLWDDEDDEDEVEEDGTY